ncbi:glycosyl hydrolase family 28-related protein [Aquimarina sp. 2201CG14-23]|uniref:glycosyl hydrolase family 28-related protein n=1 Tax=Aquimarina mycalae TaxID=3040073 RepID=UPI002477DCB4|nr:glycosyl hydrolase family 28-related protein [Aquimarina sp. 2201CG14-23]MDH7445215.1 glycosyl hydrolase family 28-related protein [Aquimarina sp. 2201CG14-23]
MKNTISFFIFFCFGIITYGQYVDVTDHGVYPFANPNQPQSVDQSDDIQRIIDDNPNRTIFFPAGKYIVKKVIEINHSIEIVGEGAGNTTFQPRNSNGFFINSRNVTIKDMLVLGQAKDLNSYTGIYVSGKANNRLANIKLESLKIQNVKIGVELKYTDNSIIDKVKILINEDDTLAENPWISQGIRFYGFCVNNQISNSYIRGESFAIGIIRDLNSHKAEGLMISNSFLGTGTYGIYSEGILSMNVSNCTIDLTKRTAIEVKDTDGMLLSNNWIASESTENHPIIKLIGSVNSHISNNTILCAKDRNNNVGVSFEINSSNNATSNNNTVIGNTMKGTNMVYKTRTYGGANNIVVYNLCSTCID